MCLIILSSCFFSWYYYCIITRFGIKMLHFSMNKSDHLRRDQCEFWIFSMYSHCKTMHFSHLIFTFHFWYPSLELLCLELKLRLQFNNQVLVIRKITSTKRTLHVWNQGEVTWCQVQWAWWMVMIVHMYCHAGQLSHEPCFVHDTALYTTDSFLLISFLHSSLHLTCTCGKC